MSDRGALRAEADRIAGVASDIDPVDQLDDVIVSDQIYVALCEVADKLEQEIEALKAEVQAARNVCDLALGQALERIKELELDISLRDGDERERE